MPNRLYGDIPGVAIGTVFDDRKALHDAGVHGPLVGGISGGGSGPADSIVMSGGYEDDTDEGVLVVYTGHGGNDPATKTQVADQELTVGNLALAKNVSTGIPIRLTRGSRLDSPFKPQHGYRYDGLYAVESHWMERGRSGFTVCRYRLRQLDGQSVPWQRAATPPTPPARVGSWVQRIVRDTEVARTVKTRYSCRCQVCGTSIDTPAGPYAEAAHIRPLGAPHFGPDEESNVLCLCPNHHVMFDRGSLSVNDDFTLIGTAGRLSVHAAHAVNVDYLRYHREHFAVMNARG